MDCLGPTPEIRSHLLSFQLKNDFFMHENLGSFFTFEGASKQYALMRGLKWEGGDSIDDYC